MGLFDFLKGKKKTAPEKPAQQEIAEQMISSARADDSSPGWEAIEDAFKVLYPEQKNPKHYGTLVKYMFGGPDPLDGISVYDGGEFWHFVSYGLSELYQKESDNPQYSGYGIEFTFKLKKKGLVKEEEEIRAACGNLQKLARYVFETGNIILPEEYIYTRQEEGIDLTQKSLLTGFITASDDLLSTLDSPNGKVQFICLIGATDAELSQIHNSDASKEEIRKLLAKLKSQMTDYSRHSMI
ncbi:suppressor of fused domain protein [Streptococcus oricebi]|uniref:Branched-chain alpha-keto acid dehydrogenase subunit E2 n=1 Tax=Streptococcus oricebi TaxID=1547447 RepID=A0ABS5B615_9STRE|nr:suppressor of fused domain protein [Streptococcus oricebi]MBP2624277.1 branched-chain alpha-keto acid dehydrogenase subunit E2 [Streptococcus oricebi]